MSVTANFNIQTSTTVRPFQVSNKAPSGSATVAAAIEVNRAVGKDGGCNRSVQYDAIFFLHWLISEIFVVCCHLAVIAVNIDPYASNILIPMLVA